MYHVTDENKNQVELESALDTIIVSTESISAVGLTLTIDGIECYGINGSVIRNTYITGRLEYLGEGNAIFVDKNHDLSYYVNGSDLNNLSLNTNRYYWSSSEYINRTASYRLGPGLYG